jgi:hypothetical protein
LLLAFAAIYPSTSYFRTQSYNASALDDIEKLRIAMKEFRRDFKVYPHSISFSTGTFPLISSGQKRTFETSFSVFMILISSDNKYAAIAGGEFGNTFYAISNAGDGTYSMKHSEGSDGVEEKDLAVLMKAYCPQMGESHWDGWDRVRD